MATETDALQAGAAEMLDYPVRQLSPVRGGGNNRIYRLVADDGRSYALKTYLDQASDRRDRLGAECSGLDFLHRNGEHRVPRFVSLDAGKRCALFEWIDGVAVKAPQSEDIAEAVSFVGSLKALSRGAEAEGLPLAAEACLSGAELARQIEVRRQRLEEEALNSRDLRSFLWDRFVPQLDLCRRRVDVGYSQMGLDYATDLPTALRTLSPSDFGFHNALRRQGGGLVFLDFEYFGWDDPVKLVADFLLHPGMSLDENFKRQFLRGARQVFAADEGFIARLSLLYPLYGLRWCLILLNEFLSERWVRRAYAGVSADREQVLAKQLAKAETMLRHVAGARGELPYDA